MEAHRATASVPRGFPLRIPHAVRAVATSTWFLGFGVFALTWGGGIVSLTTPSIDISFHAGLNIAAQEGFDYGSQMVFTYGPLGFLKSYLAFFDDTARLAALYGIALQLALALSLVWALRRNFPLVVAIGLALIAAAFARGDESAIGIRDDAAVVILALVWCVAALAREPSPLARRIVLYGAGPFAAIELLAKLNTGILVLILATITLAAIPERRLRNLVTLAASFSVTALVLWFAAGQGLDDIVPYVRGSIEVIAGYSTGARLDWQVRDYDYWLGPLLMVGVAVVAWLATAGVPWKRRAPILGMLAIVGYSAGKGGYVAHDYYHMAVFYTTVLGICLVLPLPPGRAIRWLAGAVAVAVIAGAYTTRVPGYPLANPIDNLSSGASTVARLIDGDRLEREIAAERADEVADYGLDARTLSLLEGRPVHVDPSEIAAAWAYDLDWHPLPVFQAYGAWSEPLDRRNAEALASATDGPERILRQNLDALGRYPGYESPAAMLAMLCNFEALHTTETWQVLGRVPDRCGEPRPVGSVEGAWGQPIAIPEAPPGTVLFARARGTTDSGLGALVSLLTRSEPRQVQFDGGKPWVFITGTAEDGLILRAPPEIDFPAPYALAPNPGTVTFSVLGTPPEGPITLDLYAMPVAPAGRP